MKKRKLKVGFIEETGSPISRYISLFGGKYQGTFTIPDECVAFCKGVEAVLSHVVSIQETNG